MKWELKCIEEASEQLPALLEDGWEPFTVVTKISTNVSMIAQAGQPALRATTFVYLKRQVSQEKN